MLKITPFELFFALIPESFILVFGAYVLTKTKIELKKIAISALAVAFSAYLVRLLPIFPGVNIIISMILSTLFLVVINRVEIIKAIPASLLLFVIRIGTEYLNVILIDKILHLSIDELLSNTIKRTLSGIPSLLFFALIVLLIYYFRTKKTKENSNVSY